MCLQKQKQMTAKALLIFLIVISYYSYPISSNVIQTSRTRRFSDVGIRQSYNIARTRHVNQDTIAVRKPQNGKIIFPEDDSEPLLPRPTFPPYSVRKTPVKVIEKPIRVATPQLGPKRKLHYSTSTSRNTSDKTRADRVTKSSTSSVKQIVPTVSPSNSMPIKIAPNKSKAPSIIPGEVQHSEAVTSSLKENEPIIQGSFYVPFRKFDTVKLTNETASV